MEGKGNVAGIISSVAAMINEKTSIISHQRLEVEVKNNSHITQQFI